MLPLMKDLIIKYNVNHFLAVPSFYNILLDELSENLQNAKSFTVAGEGFSEELVKKHFELLPNVELYNEYGPTENSVCSTYYKFTKERRSVAKLNSLIIFSNHILILCSFYATRF